MKQVVVTTTFLLSLILFLSSIANGHNITRILAQHPDFSTFNHYLTTTHLAGEINRRKTITILAIDNAAMSSILSKHLSIYTLKNVLSLHVLVDYFGAKKLHQISKGTTLVSSMFQATGAAVGTSGYVNITNLKGGKVGFAAEDNDELNSFYVKSIKEIPYDISVLQISHVLTSADAEAPTSGPSQVDLISTMAKQGCKAFSDLLRASKSALSTFQENIDSGLTVFCPTDNVVDGFVTRYKNLTDTQKVSLLLYHGIPVYQSLQMLKSNNGIMNTLATEGSNKKYDFTVQNDGEDVMLETKVVTATIVGTLIDQDPFVIYKINKVLLPRELFKAAPSAPAESPKPSKKKKKKVVDDDEADSPDAADAPEADVEDQTADDVNGAIGKNNGVGLVTLLVTLFMGLLVL
ncbi:fasciclin-like arabinogalactan protein 2 [Senna tora]|uniref:Fasciclin-like arabinogalactan protein 2 n=1 Tax=Senna tora TaxID=362788 RepID=A0A834TT88_9FABA|nr:fasciclin-like arabinogalactan protein 2 [Senna tora]